MQLVEKVTAYRSIDGKLHEDQQHAVFNSLVKRIGIILFENQKMSIDTWNNIDYILGHMTKHWQKVKDVVDDTIAYCKQNNIDLNGRKK